MTFMLPSSIPYRLEAVYLTGILEILAAVAIWIPGVTRIAGNGLLLLLMAVLPANVYSAFNYVGFGGHQSGPAYLLIRIPFQLFLIWWVYRHTRESPES